MGTGVSLSSRRSCYDAGVPEDAEKKLKLKANDAVLYGESHVTVRQALSRAASTSQRVRLTVARKAQTVNLFMPRPEQSLPIAYPLLAGTDDRLVKVSPLLFQYVSTTAFSE